MKGKEGEEISVPRRSLQTGNLRKALENSVPRRSLQTGNLRTALEIRAVAATPRQEVEECTRDPRSGWNPSSRGGSVHARTTRPERAATPKAHLGRTEDHEDRQRTRQRTVAAHDP